MGMPKSALDFSGAASNGPLPARVAGSVVRALQTPKGSVGFPNPFAFAGLATLLFGLTAIVLSGLTGAPLTVPTERMSAAIGVHYLVPFGTGILGYGLIQALRLGSGGRHADKRAIWGHIRTDAYFLTLFVIVVYFHFHIKMWMPLANPALFDQFYFDLDNRFRFVVDAMMATRAAIASLLPRADRVYQEGFLLLFMLALCFHAIGDRRYHYRNLIAILLTEMVGALAYLVAPAVGPFIYEDGLNAQATASQAAMLGMFQQVQQFGTAWLAEHGGQYFTGPPAAMPSLHIAVAWIITYYAFKARLVVLPLMLLLLAWFTVEAVASRWHYLVDLPAGLALAAAIIAVTNRICRGFDEDAGPRASEPSGA